MDVKCTRAHHYQKIPLHIYIYGIPKTKQMWHVQILVTHTPNTVSNSYILIANLQSSKNLNRTTKNKRNPTWCVGGCLCCRACARADWSNRSQDFCLRFTPLPVLTALAFTETFACCALAVMFSVMKFSCEIDSDMYLGRECFTWHLLRTSSETPTKAACDTGVMTCI